LFSFLIMVVALMMHLRPHDGPQTQFLASSADIAIYGGAAGGGKSYALLMEPLRHIENGKFGAVIFRRTYPEIVGEGGLWDTAGEIYPSLGVSMLDGKTECRFPSGMRVSFRHLQHEKDKYSWQGSQVPLIGFDELTHFSIGQFFYLLSRNRSTCGVKPYVRATTNPEAGSWVAEFIKWWIDQETGFPIPEHAGKVRWFVRANEQLSWSDDPDELAAEHPGQMPKSVTFVPAKLDDNPTLLEKDPSYRANLLAQPRVERERLLNGNWLAREDSIIDKEWLRRYQVLSGGFKFQAIVAGKTVEADFAKCQRFATIDTAGTSKDKAREAKGDTPSWSVCGVWDYYSTADILMLRHVWRSRVKWTDLKSSIPEVLKRWSVKKAYIENAHFGPALAEEITGCNIELIGPTLAGMRDGTNGAKLDRAAASGVLTRMETGGFFIPEVEHGEWVLTFQNEWTAWGGLPDEVADQIDVSSYAAHVCRKKRGSWGGVINVGATGR
jgi:hypothetical protein